MMKVADLKQHSSFGSYAAIGRVCGVGREAVRKWKRVPAEHCRAICAYAKGLKRSDLRPDIFGPNQGAA